MNGGSGSGRVLQIACAALAGVVVTGVAAWLALGGDRVTSSDLESVKRDLTAQLEALPGKLPYPWQTDRALVMAHVDDADIHERDGVKRTRIREELAHAAETTNIRLDSLKSDVDRLSDDILTVRKTVDEIREEIRNLKDVTP